MSRIRQPVAIPRGGTLVASLRSEPTTYNRYVDQSAAGELISLLTQAPLVRVNRTTDTLEPWLAESWSESDDGRAYTLKLRDGVTFSDGSPFSSADVLFSFAALYDPKVNSVLASDTYVAGKPLSVEAPGPAHGRDPAGIAVGRRLTPDRRRPDPAEDRLQAALDRGAFRDAWGANSPLSDIAGLGPFVLSAHVSGQRLTFSRNPRYWRKDPTGAPLPYLDTLTVLLVGDQNTEAVRMQSGDLDLMANGEIRPEDYVGFKRLADRVSLRLDRRWCRHRSQPVVVQPVAGADPRLTPRLASEHRVPPGGVVCGRSRGDRQHRPFRRRGGDLLANHARQPDLVRPGAARLRPRSTEGPPALCGSRPH